jgi:hypothetical protein
MKRSNVAGSVLQALQPVAEKRVEMQQRALAGQATAVVQMGCELADALREAGRLRAAAQHTGMASSPSRSSCVSGACA